MASEESHVSTAPGQGLDFIRSIVADDLRSGAYDIIVTRFPPEPNGYLHIGHAKSIVLNFGIAAETGGRCHLRYDDTNPETEDAHYVDAIRDAVRWLGFDWGQHLYFASDYFDQMYGLAQHLIREGNAYVDSLNEEEIREYRGTVTVPGRESPFRSRSAEENLELLQRMRAGDFPDGTHVLRAKIDMASRNMVMRDPVFYRIRHSHHFRTADRWCIYPLYDYAHPIEDAVECVTHSICTLEFESRRPLYDWVVEAWERYASSGAGARCRPRQYEFARLNLDYTVMSKRKLLELVRGGYVSGWDDPRMPTVAGLRRRGVTPQAIRSFCEMIGVAKTESRVDIGKLEFAIRNDLNQSSPRVLCVLRPLRVVITNYPEDAVEDMDAPFFPHDVPKEGSRPLPFSRVLYIDRDDFAEDPPKGYFRLAPGREVRLRYAYIIRCDEVIRDGDGEIMELRCSYDPGTRGGTTPDGRVVKGTIQWVSAQHSLPCEVRLYDRLFSVSDPDAAEGDFKMHLNPESLVVVANARIEPSVGADPPGSRYQFERLGFFCSDSVESGAGGLVFNRTVTLRDTWAKVAQGASTEPGRSQRKRQREAAGGAERASADRPRSSAPALPDVRTPELEGRRARYLAELKLAPEEADILTRDLATSNLFETGLEAGVATAKGLANWVIHELAREIGDMSIANLPPTGRDLAALVALVEDKTLSSSAARQVLTEMVRTGEAPEPVVERLGLRQVSDRSALDPVLDAILDANQAKVAEYRAGRSGLRGFFIGQVMRQTGGRANPELVGAMLDERLGA